METNTVTRRRFPWWGIVLIVLGVLTLGSCCCVSTISGIVFPKSEPVVVAPVVEAPVVEAPVVEAPVVEAPVVEAPVVEAPVVEAPVVEAPVVEAPVYLYQILVDDEIVGVPLDNGAVATTTGRILTGHDAPYSTDELKIIEATAVTFQVTNDGSGMTVAFGYTVEDHTGGVIQYLGTDSPEITITNGELVIWPNFDLMMTDINNRIPDEIQNGNADFNSLAFHWISREFRGFVDDSLITARGVQILP